ncbi:MAG: metal-dependent phosphohydrolase [Pseudomonadota bacterium]
MFDPTDVLARQFGTHLAETYLHHCGAHDPGYAPLIGAAAQSLIARLATTDAPYHDVRHTVMVVLAGQQILCGRALDGPVPAQDWLHLTLALLCHDIGYVSGVLAGDNGATQVADETGQRITLARGATDAALAPYHVDRSKLFMREHFAASEIVDVDRLCASIEYTRFPVPDDNAYAETGTEAGLVRAADLIGQLGDPLQPRRVAGLYREFVETGMAERLGYASPADIREGTPAFYRAEVEPFIGDALALLRRTAEGQRWVAALQANVGR